MPSAFIDADTHAGADGRFRIVVPAISGLEITGDALGWIPDRQTPFLEGATQGAPIRLHLTLQKAERLQGRCLDEDGKPVADAQVNCYVVLRESARGEAHVEDARASYPGGGVTVVSGPNGTQMTVRRAGRTDADGRFDIPIVAHGETVLVARARGRTIARQAVARSEFRDGATLTLRSSPDVARKLRIVARTGGDPVVRCQCVVGDLDTGYPFQPAFTITTDDRGDLPTEWLEDGHLYMIVPCQPSAPVAVYTCGGRFFRWSGQSSLALLDLPTQPNEVR